MAIAASKLALVTACMTASGATNPLDPKVRQHYEAIFDMVVAMLAVAQVAPGAFIAPGGLTPAPLTGIGGPIS
jgi:hypothetical protein